MVVAIVIVLALAATGSAGWLWWRSRKAHPRLLRDTTHLGPFVDLQLLSDKGGMARIYRAKNSETRRDCVLKVLRSEMLGNPEVVKKFRREADILQTIKQAAPDAPVVSVYSTGTISTSFVELPYIEMEFIPGGTDLSDYLRQHNKVDPEIAASIVAQVVRALRCADGIAVHRDLKPGNILLAGGDPCQVVVCDFGVAKDMDSRSLSQSAFGTAAYMAPEQCVQEGRVSPATDVYALGLIWYRMLTGSLLFDDSNPLVVMRYHVERDPRPEVESGVPAPYRQLLLRMIAKDPKQRPGFDELAKTFPDASRRFGLPLPAGQIGPERTALLGFDLPGPPVVHGEQASPRRKRNPRRVAIGAVAGAAACGLAYLLWLWSPVKVVVRTEPPGAEVRVDGHVTGRTPLIMSMVPGNHRIQLALAGHEPFEISEYFQRGRDRVIVQSLTPSALVAINQDPAPSEAAVPAGFTTGEIDSPERVEKAKSAAPRGNSAATGEKAGGGETVPVVSTPPRAEGMGTPPDGPIVEGPGSGPAPALQPATTSLDAPAPRGSLTITSTPAAAIAVDEVARGVAPLTMDAVEVGKHKVTATIEGSSPQEEWVNVEAGRQAQVAFLFKKEWGHLTVRSPAPADILLDGNGLVGVTPVERLPLPVGSHALTARAPGYRDFRATVEIQRDTERIVDLALEKIAPTTGQLTVDVQPAGSRVEIDGVGAGQSPLFDWKLDPGGHRVTASAAGRRSLERNVTISAGKTEVVSGTLDPIVGTVEIVSEPPGLEVRIDGVARGKTPLLLSDQAFGRHQADLMQAGRSCWQGEFLIDGSRERELVRAACAPPQPGSISVNVTEKGKPSWGAVIVDGKSMGNSPVLLKELPPQEYTIRVQRFGYQQKEVKVTLLPGERKLVTVDIQP